jgi:hypothetical protein
MKIKEHFGSFTLKLYDNIELVHGSFNSKYEREYFISEISKDNEVEFAYVSRLIDGEIVNEVIFDNKSNCKI